MNSSNAPIEFQVIPKNSTWEMSDFCAFQHSYRNFSKEIVKTSLTNRVTALGDKSKHVMSFRTIITVDKTT